MQQNYIITISSRVPHATADSAAREAVTLALKLLLQRRCAAAAHKVRWQCGHGLVDLLACRVASMMCLVLLGGVWEPIS